MNKKDKKELASQSTDIVLSAAGSLEARLVPLLEV